jgi:hypothetical protein
MRLAAAARTFWRKIGLETAEEAAQDAGPTLFNKTLRLPSIMISQKS